MSKTLILKDIEEHQADLLKEIFEEFAQRHRNDEKAELNGRHIGESQLVEVEELIDAIYTGDITDMEDGEVKDTLDWFDPEVVGKWIGEKLGSRRG